MIRSTGTLAFFFLLLFAATAQPQDRPLRDPRIRSSDPEVLDAIETGAQASETLRELIAHVEASDIVVYVVLRPSPSPSVAAHVSFISAAGGRRYVYIVIDPRYGGCQLTALLGHELQHVVEIADEPSVVDERSLAEFYRRIGFATNGWALERFESQRAIDAGQRVMREMLAPGSVASRAR
jgi:hypothetical protein